MAISDYTSLQSSIASWLARSDLGPRIPDFIALFETRMNRLLRTAGAEVVTDLTPDANGIAPLPVDYREWRAVNLTGGGSLEFLTPSAADDLYGGNSGVAQGFTILGSNLIVYPLATGSVTLSYYRGVTPLSNITATNWLILRHPDLYLFGSLVEAEAYAANDDRLALWKARVDEVLAEVMSEDQSARWGRSRMQIGWVP